MSDLRNQATPNASELRYSLQEFKRFPELPKELRALIWEFACFLPRNVDLRRKTLEPREYSGQMLVERLVSSSRVPAILHTNNEARTMALQHYKPQSYISESDTELRPGCGTVAPEVPAVYVNFKCDTIYLIDFVLTPNNVCFPELESVPFIALNVALYVAPSTSSFIRRPLRALSGHDVVGRNGTRKEVLLYHARPDELNRITGSPEIGFVVRDTDTLYDWDYLKDGGMMGPFAPAERLLTRSRRNALRTLTTTQDEQNAHLEWDGDEWDGDKDTEKEQLEEYFAKGGPNIKIVDLVVNGKKIQKLPQRQGEGTYNVEYTNIV